MYSGQHAHVRVAAVKVEAETGSVLRDESFRLLGLARVRLARHSLQFHQIFKTKYRKSFFSYCKTSSVHLTAHRSFRSPFEWTTA